LSLLYLSRSQSARKKQRDITTQILDSSLESQVNPIISNDYSQDYYYNDNVGFDKDRNIRQTSVENPSRLFSMEYSDCIESDVVLALRAEADAMGWKKNRTVDVDEGDEGEDYY
jgi:hypothetical protein